MLTPKENIINLEPYSIASYPTNWDMKLDANENYIGPSTQVLKALKSISVQDISQYPYYGELYSILADILDVCSNEIVLTNGADEAIYAVLNTYISKNDKVVTVTPSFVMPKIYSNLLEANYIEIPYKNKWEYPLDDIKNCLSQGAKALIITSPNNPTGDIVSKAMIEDILISFPETLVILDETYANYSGNSNVKLAQVYQNLAVIRSMSKDYALAGLRLGYVVSDSENILNIRKVLSPYNVNNAAVIAAKAALADKNYLSYVVNEISESREFLSSELQKMGVIVYKSHANFILADMGKKAELFYNILKANKVIVKRYRDEQYLENCLRITVPTLSASKRILEFLKTKITLVFDMDGVLVDVSKSYYEAIKYTYNYFTGKTITDEQICDAKKKGGLNNDWDLTSYLIKQSGFDFSYEKIVDVFQSNYWKDGSGSINNETLLIDKSLLNKLAEKYNLAIFTGRPGQEALFTLSKFEIKDYFGKIVTMDDLPKDRQKPDTMGLSIIKDSFFTDYLVYFGDSIDDMKCAKNFVSTFAVGVLPPQNKTDDLKHTLQHSGADKVINCINDLQKILENN